MSCRFRYLALLGLLGTLLASRDVALSQAIRLGDVTAGGDGTGTAPAVNTGVDERTGRLTTGYFDGPISMGGALDDGVNPSAVPDSPYVDSVFFIEPGGPGGGAISQRITQSGVRFDSFLPSDGGGAAWNYILKDRNGGVSTPGIQVGGISIPTGSAVGIHASMGITFDLDALRAHHGADRIGCFTTFWGLDNCDTGDVNLYAILASDAGVIAGGWRTFRALGSVGQWVEMEIPATAKYLTLATGTNNGGTCGHGTFGDAKITCSPCPTPSFTDLESVAPRQVSTQGGTEVTFTGKAFSSSYLYLIGGQPVTGVLPVDALMTQVRGVAPALLAGRYDVQVMLPTGGVVACLKDAVEAAAPSGGAPCGGVFPAAADASIVEAQPFTNFGSGPLAVARQGTGEEHALVSFDLASAAPSASTIWSARLELTLWDVAGAERYTLSAREAKGPWNEATASWSSQPSVGPVAASVTTAQRVGAISFDVTALVRRRFLEGASDLSFSVAAESTGLCTFHERLLSTGGPDPDGPRLVVRCAPTLEGLPVDQTDGDAMQRADLDRLRASSRIPVSLRVARGAVRFASFDLAVPPAVGTDRVAQAEWLLDSYRDLLQRSDQSDEWQLVRRSPDGRIIVFRQLHDGIPVFPAEISVFLGDGRALSLGGASVPEISLPAVERISAKDAEALALASAADRVALNPQPLPPRVMGDTQLRYLNLGLLGDEDKTTHLAWRVNVATAGEEIGMFVDALNGALLYTQRRANDAFDLELKTRNGAGPVDWSCWAPGAVLLFDENGKVVSSPPAEATMAFGNIKTTYDFYKSELGRDSWDNSGKKIEMHINVNFPNNAMYASWCSYLEFGNGMAALDVVGHEFTHGVVHHTCDLEYQTQSGALDESFADIFGHFIDNGNWTIGETSAAGTLRDMSSPPVKGHPDHMLAGVSGDGKGLRVLGMGVQPECDRTNMAYNDCGFVHTNSGIHNKAAYLLIAGGIFNGRSIPAIGQKKAEQLFYFTILGLNNHSQFIDARDRAVWTAGQFATQPWFKFLGFTLSDACAVQNAYAAVGLGQGDADCDGKPDNVESDADGDGILDGADNCPFVSNMGQSDVDKDGLGDACDPDADNDGVPNRDPNGQKLDNCPLVSNKSQADWDGDKIGDACDDSDGDGIVDALDRCRTVYDPTNKDTDFDGLGDVCDPDIDGDGKPNSADNCPLVYNPNQNDSDTDTIGDACDLCPGVSDPDNGDPDGDGLGNPCDPDDDNDGVLDDGDGSGVIGDHPCKGGVKTNCDDNCREVPNPDQFDGDKNGIGFVCDGAEQIQLIRDSIYQLEVSLLPLPDPTSVVLSVCPSCGPSSYLAEGFTSIAHVEAPVPVIARVVDSNGIIVASATEGGTSVSVAFEPVPYGATSDDGGPPGAGGVAGGLMPSKTLYRLQIIPVEPTDPNQLFAVKIQIEESVPRLFIRADANGDNRLDISDAVAVLHYLFLGAVAPPCLDAADANDDGELDIADGIRILLYLFADVPLPPGTTPGVPQKDPTPDALGCGG